MVNVECNLCGYIFVPNTRKYYNRDLPKEMETKCPECGFNVYY